MYVTLQSSTCFEHQHAHLQEDKMYYHSIWYRHSLYNTVQYAGCCDNTFCPPEDASLFRSLPAEGSILCLSIWDISRIKWHRDRFLSEYFSVQFDVPASLPQRKNFYYILHVRMRVLLVSTRMMWRIELLYFFFVSTTAP